MELLQFNRFGAACDVVELVETRPAPSPGPGEVRVVMLASPINPSDLLKTEGRYGASIPVLPQGCGVEGVGRVMEAGSGVRHLRAGDLVLLRYGGKPVWTEALTLDAARLFALPPADPVQLSMLAANPATARLMLDRAGALKPGDWVLQNAANSGVGQCVVQLARELGLRTVNFVRSAEAARLVRDLGGDVVLSEGEEVPQECSRVARLAFDAVGGTATARLARHLATDGTLVSYGLMSGRNAEIDPADLIFRGVRAEGFWLAPWAQKATTEELERLYRPLAGLVANGKLHMKVEQVYDLADFRAALRHAARDGRKGKIIFRGT
jgi:NADPH:quinone reductase-like Zn-dependent oxidoreductase